jgi:ABC-type uncharacterized transport system permease subunit
MEGTFFSLSEKIISLINMGISIVIGLAVIGFMYGIVRFLFDSTNEKARKEARSFMLYGILTLFVMTSLWGLVHMLSGTINIGEEGYIGDVNTDENNSEPDPFDDVDELFDNNNDQGLI